MRAAVLRARYVGDRCTAGGADKRVGEGLGGVRYDGRGRLFVCG